MSQVLQTFKEIEVLINWLKPNRLVFLSIG